MNVKLEAALAYSRMRWRIFPCHSIVPTPAGPACSCGKASCGSPGKHPRTRGGFKDATDDAEQILKWWTRWPDANIALATGSGLAVIDIDGEQGASEFKALVETYEAIPETLAAATGRGYHLVFATRPGSPEVRSSARGAVHVRGDGGYVVVAPSNHISGKEYKWIRQKPVALLPEWLRQWSQGYEIVRNNSGNNDAFQHLGDLPKHLSYKNHEDVTKTASEALKTAWSPVEQTRLISALATIPADQYESWFQVGMALQALGWERSDGTDLGLVIWDQWSQLCPAKYSLGGCEDKWKTFGRSNRVGITVASIYHMARQHGWNGGAPALASPPMPTVAKSYVNGHAADTALPAAFLTPPQGTAIHFPDINSETGLPKSTCTNAGVAITAMGISCRKDLFHEKMMVGGQPIQQWAGDLSDDVVAVIRKLIRFRFGFDPNKANTTDACIQLCLEHQFDPVCDYLDGLRWDSQLRLDSWLQRYLSAANTELNRSIGRLALIAAVRRARRPGTKFDQIVVLEGVEGKGKSTAIEIMAGRENFSDQKILGLTDKEQQEAITGIWLYEIAELTGMRRAETDHVKAFASRTVDRARPAYGRFRVDRPRRAICFATTNDDEYLKSETGNRRFWPVLTGHIDLEGLKRDRDQLWAEAAAVEAQGVSIGLPERLWAAAGEEQDRRKEADDWFEKISNYIALKGSTDVTVSDVLCDNQFIQRKPDAISRGDAMRAGAILKRLRFARYHKRIENGYAWRYRRMG